MKVINILCSVSGPTLSTTNQIGLIILSVVGGLLSSYLLAVVILILCGWDIKEALSAPFRRDFYLQVLDFGLDCAKLLYSGLKWLIFFPFGFLTDKSDIS